MMGDVMTLPRQTLNAGITATAIITERFMQTAQVMAQVSGRPGFPFAVITPPISSNDDTVLRATAEAAVQQCVAILLPTAALPLDG
jgi:hypothetical protein